jgi:hypothetical protein
VLENRLVRDCHLELEYLEGGTGGTGGRSRVGDLVPTHLLAWRRLYSERVSCLSVSLTVTVYTVRESVTVRVETYDPRVGTSMAHVGRHVVLVGPLGRSSNTGRCSSKRS